MRTSTHPVGIAISIAISCSATAAMAQPRVPFTEDFTRDSARWYDAPGTSPLGWNAGGGPDGGSHAFGPFNFVNSRPNDTPVILRAQDELGSSDGAFEGNWITAGVTFLTAQVRHNADVPLNFFARMTPPANFPGAVAVDFTPLPPRTWREISFAIDPNSRQFVTFEGSDFNSIFRNIGHVQFGVMVPDALAGRNEPFTFDVDKVALVPEPAAATLLIAGLLALGRRRVTAPWEVGR